MRMLRQVQHGFSDVVLLLKELVGATKSNAPTDYSEKINEVIKSLEAINADTTLADTILKNIDVSGSAIESNTKETVVKLEDAIKSLVSIDENTSTQEKSLSGIIDTLNAIDKKVLNPVFIGDSCASVDGGEPVFVGIVALYNSEGVHSGVRYIDSNGVDLDITSVKLLDECDCKVGYC